MTDHKILNTIVRMITAIILIGASIAIPLSAAATENSFLSAEFHAAAMEATDRLKGEFKHELAETIRQPTALGVNLARSTEAIDDAVQEDRPMSSDVANVTFGDERPVRPDFS